MRPQSKLRFHGRVTAAFSLIELLVVISIISLLVSILIPSLNQAKELARQAVCATNLRSLATMAHMYANDHNGNLMPMDEECGSSVATWLSRISLDRKDYLLDYGLSEKLVECPSSDAPLFWDGTERNWVVMNYAYLGGDRCSPARQWSPLTLDDRNDLSLYTDVNYMSSGQWITNHFAKDGMAEFVQQVFMDTHVSKMDNLEFVHSSGVGYYWYWEIPQDLRQYINVP